MTDHVKRTRRHLGDLASLAAHTEASERRILSNAERRLGEVQSWIDRALPGIESAPEASQRRYLSLVAERAQLNTVIGKSRAALGEA